MGPTGNDQQTAGAGASDDNPPAAMPGQVVSPGGGTSQSSDGVLTISHNDTPADAVPAAPVASDAGATPPADLSAPPAGGQAPSGDATVDDPELADVDSDPSQPTALDATPEGDPVLSSTPEPADSTITPPAPDAGAAAPADPNAGTPGEAAPQQ